MVLCVSLVGGCVRDFCLWVCVCGCLWVLSATDRETERRKKKNVWIAYIHTEEEDEILLPKLTSYPLTCIYIRTTYGSPYPPVHSCVGQILYALLNSFKINTATAEVVPSCLVVLLQDTRRLQETCGEWRTHLSWKKRTRTAQVFWECEEWLSLFKPRNFLQGWF